MNIEPPESRTAPAFGFKFTDGDDAAVTTTTRKGTPRAIRGNAGSRGSMVVGRGRMLPRQISRRNAGGERVDHFGDAPIPAGRTSRRTSFSDRPRLAKLRAQ